MSRGDLAGIFHMDLEQPLVMQGTLRQAFFRLSIRQWQPTKRTRNSPSSESLLLVKTNLLTGFSKA